LSEEEVLEITDEMEINYYCKDNICSFSNDNIYVSHTDGHGNIKEYIHDTFSSHQKITQSKSKCTKDSQCLTNKCIDNYCRFNDEVIIIHCGEIASFNAFKNKYNTYTHTHCGKLYGDTCNNDDECSSKSCTNGTCNRLTNNYSDNAFSSYAVLFILNFYFYLCIISCCCICIIKISKNIKQ
ncbi:hypothetical protein BCR36DRAFT_286464, partial [Piromyces finnis]